MPLVKPSSTPIWASANPVDPTSGENAIATPTNTKIQDGFARNEEPPRQDFNWFFNLITLWTTYLEDLTDAQLANLGDFLDSQLVTPAPDLTGSAGYLSEALDSKFLDDSFLSGFRVTGFNLTAGDTVGVQITRGQARMNDNSFTVNTDRYAGPDTFNKQILKGNLSAPFAWGDGEVGLADAAFLTDNTWYHLFLIYRSDAEEGDSPYDFGFDPTITAYNLAGQTGASKFRRIASLYYQNATLGFRQFNQLGDIFIYKTPVVFTDVYAEAPAGTIVTEPILATSFAPFGVDVLAFCRVNFTGIGAGSRAILQGPLDTALDLDNVALFNEGGLFDVDITTPAGVPEILDKNIALSGIDPTLYLRHQAAPSGLTLRLAVRGYVDLRGKDWGAGNNRGHYFNA